MRRPSLPVPPTFRIVRISSIGTGRAAERYSKGKKVFL